MTSKNSKDKATLPTVDVLIALGREYLNQVEKVTAHETGISEQVTICYRGGTTGRKVLLDMMNQLQGDIDKAMKATTLPEDERWTAANQRKHIPEYRIKEVYRSLINRVAKGTGTLQPMTIKTTIKNKGKKNESKVLKWSKIEPKSPKTEGSKAIDTTHGVSCADLLDKSIEMQDGLTDRDIVLNFRSALTRAGKEKDILVFTHDDLIQFVQDEIKRETRKSSTTTTNKKGKKAA